MAGEPLVLTVIDPATDTMFRYVFPRSPVIVGSYPRVAQLCLARDSIAGAHGEFSFDDATVTFRDLGSSEGSRIGRRQLSPGESVRVYIASEIWIGSLKLMISRIPPATMPKGPDPFAPAAVSGPPSAPAPAAPLCFAQTTPVESVDPKPPEASEGPMATSEAPTRMERAEAAKADPPGDRQPPSSSPASGRPAEMQPGDVVSHYRIERLLGRGGMGWVYEVSHSRLSAKRFAMKVLAPDTAAVPEAEPMFLREAEVISRISHPHVVNMVDFGQDRGTSYLVMELLEGEDLANLIRRREIPVQRIADIMLAVCSGVTAAHEMGVIHRDLKPQNIFLCRTPTGESVPKVLDFGISKLREPGKENFTQQFGLLGTPNYISPEQATNGRIDARCDIYALGTILYESATGRRCHDGESLYEILQSIAEARYPAPSQLRPGLSNAFESVILKALQRVPDRRFSTAHELGRALLPFASPKRQASWGDYYLRPPGLADSTFNGVPLSLSQYRPPLSEADIGREENRPDAPMVRIKDAREFNGPETASASPPRAKTALLPPNYRGLLGDLPPASRDDGKPAARSDGKAAPGENRARRSKRLWAFGVIGALSVAAGIEAFIIFRNLIRTPLLLPEQAAPNLQEPRPAVPPVPRAPGPQPSPSALPATASPAPPPTPVAARKAERPSAQPLAAPANDEQVPDSPATRPRRTRLDGKTIRTSHRVKRNSSGIPILR